MATTQASIRSGYLFKEGRFLHSYKKAWYVLTNDTLQQFKSPSGGLDQTILLTQCQFELEPPPVGKRPFQFKLKTSKREYHFAANDDVDLNAWRVAFNSRQASGAAAAAAVSPTSTTTTAVSAASPTLSQPDTATTAGKFGARAVSLELSDPSSRGHSRPSSPPRAQAGTTTAKPKSAPAAEVVIPESIPPVELAYGRKTVPADIVTELQQHHRALDSGKDLSFFQFLRGVYMSYFSTNSLLLRLFQVFDVDKDQFLNFEEYLTGLACMLLGTPTDQATMIFRVIDVDSDGRLSRKELYDMIKASAEISAVLAVVSQRLSDAMSQDRPVNIDFFSALKLAELRTTIIDGSSEQASGRDLNELLLNKMLRDAQCPNGDTTQFMSYPEFMRYALTGPAVLEWFHALVTMIQQAVPSSLSAESAERYLQREGEQL
eukprot:TRINITY_DN7421_c0_g1_i1.p1 TRINITY_DN7421_c0_g1~~TRINITY_DN7421_c0_g1_i1.p1  ORF type:complete len:432 (-),score=105.40 TRINITY_DN7421_c0_g1_i1:178-1473(-)